MEDTGDDSCRFFDAPEDISVMSSAPSEDEVDGAEEASSSAFAYDVWLQSPGSVRERRCEFFSSIGIWLDNLQSSNALGASEDSCKDVDWVKEGSGAVLRNSGFEDRACSSSLSVSSVTTDDSDWSRELAVKEASFVCRAENFYGATECCVDDIDQTISSTSSAHQPEETVDVTMRSVEQPRKRMTKWWLGRLRSMPCGKDKRGVEVLNLGDRREWPRAQKVKVRHRRKNSKELSALFTGQEFQADKGAILKMKFSPDGRYLASAGEDGIVRLWQVVEDDRCNNLDIPENDPSCIYFKVDHISKLTPLFADKEKMGNKPRSLRKTSDSACVIFPPKIFRLLEKPLCEFRGHKGEILDLAWSNDNCLLSASTDKTVRMWQVGCGRCLGVFRHSNYVTCIQFNPTDNRQFITGSLDGKLRIWDILDSRVVEWTGMREIITAVCYRPDSQGVVVGCMSGSCHFYCFSDNHLQLDGQVCLRNKKKAPCKRITGIEFLPQDSSKMMVTSADSQIRILDGLNVTSRYRGNRTAGNKMIASFTTEGNHIISASEDSGISLWNCNKQDGLLFSETRVIRSCEHFASNNASVAIPWCETRKERTDSELRLGVQGAESLETLSYSPACFFLGQEFFLESFPKSSATWPEEKLPSSTKLASSPPMHKTQYKFLRSSCQSASDSHAWGLVIVTAGWDGRIRSFLNYGLPVTRRGPSLRRPSPARLHIDVSSAPPLIKKGEGGDQPEVIDDTKTESCKLRF